MNEILFTIGDWPVHTGEALLGFAALALILLLTIAIIIARSGSRGAALAMAQAIRADELEERVSEMLRAQSEATGRVHEMGQALAGRQADMARAVNERLDSVTHRVGQSMERPPATPWTACACCMSGWGSSTTRTRTSRT